MKDLKINNNFIAALLILMGLFYKWAAIAAAIVILYNASNEWLKKMMVRLLVVIFVFYIMLVGIRVFEQAFLLMDRLVKLPNYLMNTVFSLATLLEYSYLGFMALKAYRGKVFTISFVEKIVEKVYQYENIKSFVSMDECCPKCGNKWNDGDMFCQKCGTKR